MAAPPPASSPPTSENTTPGGGGGTTSGGGGTTSQPTTSQDPTTSHDPTTTSSDPTTSTDPTTTQPPTTDPTTSQDPGTTSNPDTTSQGGGGTTSQPPPTTSQGGDTTSQGGAQTTSAGREPSTSFVTTTQIESSVLPDGSTSYKYKTITEPGAVSSGAAAAGHKKSNTGAIVGGVVGGVGGAVLIAALIGLFFWYRRRKNRDVAFDDKMFDPQHSGRHSQADPLDSMAPSVPSVGIPGEPTTIEPFPYEAPHNGGYHESYDGHDYDQSYYSSPSGHHPQQSMTMPDARDYMAGSGGNYGNEGGYGASMFGAGAAAGAAGAAAKHREAMQERTGALSPNHSGSRGSNMSHFEDAQSYNNHHGMYQQAQGQVPQSPEQGSPTPAGGNRTSMLSDGQGGVYQHTDMMSETTGTDVDEIPPTYTSISPGRL